MEDNETNYLTNRNTSENSLYNNFKNENSLYSDNSSFINNTYGTIYSQNTFKSILNKNNFSSNYNSDNNIINNTNSIFRMTAVRKANTNKINNNKYLIRSSIYDDFLKKKHPDNIKKTLKPRKRSLFSNVNNINPNDLINLKKINEGNKENEESQSESESENEKKDNKNKEKKGNIEKDKVEDIYENNEDINENSDNIEDNDEKNEKNVNNDKKENSNELGEILNIRLSLSFDDNDDDDDEDENNINNEEEDMQLFNMIDNENDDEELIELKKLYCNADDKEKENDKKNDKEKEEEEENDRSKEKENKKDKAKEKEGKIGNEKEEKKPKGILKKMISKFDIVRSILKKQIKFSNIKKTILRKSSTRELNPSTNNSYIDDLDRYEERLKEIDKNYQIFNDKEENLEKKSSRFMRINSKFEIIPQNIEEDINE